MEAIGPSQDAAAASGADALASPPPPPATAAAGAESQPEAAAPAPAPASAPAAAPHTTKPSRKRKRRRSSRPPSSDLPVRDTVTVLIPLNVTADLGVAMRRTRAKRIRKLRGLFPDLVPKSRTAAAASGRDGGEAAAAEEEGGSGDEDGEGLDENKKKNGEKDGKKKKKKLVAAEEGKEGGDGNEEEEEDLLMDATGGGTPRREQYGSVLDYLEAKYVRGVTVTDLDGDAQDEQGKGGAVEDDDDDDDNSNAGSVYSDESGNFLDDSMLRYEVAEQVMATSGGYGTTRVEEEARRAKREQQLGEGSGAGEGGADAAANGAGGGKAGEGAYFADDDAFFVNVGDLEMADESYEDGAAMIDWGLIDGKNKKKKSVTKKKRKRKGEGASDAASAQGKKKKTKKSEESTGATGKKGKAKQQKQQQPAAAKKKKKKAGAAATASPKKSAEKKAKPAAAAKKKKAKKVEEEKKTKASSRASSDADADEEDNSNDDEEEEEGNESSEDGDGEPSERAIKLKVEADHLKSTSDKLHKLCVDLIKKLKPDDCPRKPKAKVKVSIQVPPGKKAGDSITFANPHIPGQKLKVNIPKSGKPGGTFFVSVPLPKIKKVPKKENTFPKDLREALDDFSQSYDDWCEAEAKYRKAAPKKGKGKKEEPFKPGTERLKKYDAMLKAFPKDLLYPIDAIFLRKVVRRVRQNAQKRRKHMGIDAAADSGGTTQAAKKRKYEEKLAGLLKDEDGSEDEEEEDEEDAPPAVLTLRVPGKGTTFPTVHYDAEDFDRGHL